MGNRVKDEKEREFIMEDWEEWIGMGLKIDYNPFFISGYGVQVGLW